MGTIAVPCSKWIYYSAPLNSKLIWRETSFEVIKKFPWVSQKYFFLPWVSLRFSKKFLFSRFSRSVWTLFYIDCFIAYYNEYKTDHWFYSYLLKNLNFYVFQQFSFWRLYLCLCFFSSNEKYWKACVAVN